MLRLYLHHSKRPLLNEYFKLQLAGDFQSCRIFDKAHRPLLLHLNSTEDASCKTAVRRLKDKNSNPRL
jgi:hypothetical protein